MKTVCAIILAADQPSAGTASALLSFGGTSLLKKQIAAMKSAGIEGVIVVSGYMAESIADEAGADVKTICNPDCGCGMLTSVKAGVSALSSSGCDGIMLLP